MKPHLFKNLITKSLLIGILLMIGCKEKEVEGIVIGHTLWIHQELKENRELADAIRNVLKKDANGINQILSIDCGGGAGCYDLGFVVSQLIYRVGEDEFVRMINRMDKKKIRGIIGLIRVGLEYGDNDKDGMEDNKKISAEFPLIEKMLTE